MTTAKGYTEMKDSGIQWIGQIPTHWLLKKAKYCVSITNGSDPKSEGSVPVYGSGSESFKTCGEYKEGPAVLIGRKGATLHIPHYIEGRYWNVDTAFDVKPQEGFSLRYYYYLACVFDYNYYISQTTLPGMTQTNYNNMKLPCPSLDEQTAIASYLDTQCAKIDEIIAQAKASIEDYKQWKASIIYEAVTKGLDPNVEMKDSGVEWVGMIPKHWTIIANKYVMHKEKRICEKWNGQDVLSLTMNGVIIRDILNPVGKMPTTFDGYQFAYAGELLMCLFDIDVTPRCVGRVFNDGVTSPAYSCFQLNNNADLGYFYYYYLMVDNTKELLHLAKNLRHSFTEEQLGQLKVPLPPLREQSAIASYLDTQCAKIDELVAKKQSLIDDLESYKKSLIYEVVTGKRRVY